MLLRQLEVEVEYDFPRIFWSWKRVTVLVLHFYYTGLVVRLGRARYGLLVFPGARHGVMQDFFVVC